MESGGKDDGGGRVGDGGGRNQSKPPSTKSCKGYLIYDSYYSDVRSRGPHCYGVSRTVPKEFGEILPEIPPAKEGRRLIGFYYACLGYGLYRDGNNQSTDKERTEVPYCLGFELVVEKRAQATDTASPATASLHNKEGLHPQTPQTRKPIHSPGGDDFYSRFARNAGLVASGVSRNMKRVGNYVKQNIDNILDRRPK